MSRIVFASCISEEASGDQPVWTEAIAHKPDWLVLCGDNIYMDYFPNLYQSKEWKPPRFAKEMQERYARQFKIPSFQALVKSLPEGRVLGTWDDHDFAWNNCFGTDPGDDMPVKRKIATALYHHFFDTLNKRPLPAELLPLAIPDLANPPNGKKDVYRTLRIEPLQVLLCDGRTYREDNTTGSGSPSLLGAAQEKWLFDELARGQKGPFLLVTGSTMTAGDDQSWDSHRDFFNKRFLPAVKGKTVIFLAGDVHENRLPPRKPDWPIEVVSSAAVLGFPLNRRDFGVLDVSNTEATVFLYKRGQIEYTGRVDLATGAFKTSMAALVKDTPIRMTTEDAQAQREEALELLGN